MTDEEFLSALEDCSLPKENFKHVDHVRAGYLYLKKFPFGAALDRIKETIQRYAKSLGVSGLYHETITVAYMALINERLAQHGDAGSWDAFAARNPALFDKDMLSRHYSKDILDSDLARQVFVLG